jgi:hypothetical protein
MAVDRPEARFLWLRRCPGRWFLLDLSCLRAFLWIEGTSLERICGYDRISFTEEERLLEERKGKKQGLVWHSGEARAVVWSESSRGAYKGERGRRRSEEAVGGGAVPWVQFQSRPRQPATRAVACTAAQRCLFPLGNGADRLDLGVFRQQLFCDVENTPPCCVLSPFRSGIYGCGANSKVCVRLERNFVCLKIWHVTIMWRRN